MVADAPVFAGVGVALATLFDERAEVDLDATAGHAARLVADGVRAVVIAGSTGEAPTLSLEERAALLTAVRDRIGGEVPVIAGTGATWARQAVTFTLSARREGADAALVLSPLRSDDPLPYYQAVAEAAGDMPLLAYHFPAMSPPGIPIGVLPRLPVRGVKDSSGDPDRLLATVDTYAGDVYVGSSALLTQAGALGCVGAILALANLEPRLCAAAFAGDGDAQRQLAAAHRAATQDFPRGLKQALADRFGTSPVVRMS